MNIALTIIDENQSIGSVKLQIESSKNNFSSSNAMALHKSKEWKIINNFAIVENEK